MLYEVNINGRLQHDGDGGRDKPGEEKVWNDLKKQVSTLIIMSATIHTLQIPMTRRKHVKITMMKTTKRRE